MKIIGMKEFSQLLSFASDLSAGNDVVLTKDSMQLTFSIDGRDIKARFQQNGVRLTNQDYERLLKLAPSQRGTFAPPASVEDPSIKHLKKHGGPLYWNREWLAEKVSELGSYAEVSRVYSKEVRGVGATAIANYARDKFGWKTREVTKRKRHEVIDEYERLNGDITQPALAVKYSVAVSTVNRWISEARQAYTELVDNRRRYISDEARERFAEDRNLTAEIVFRWLDEGSSVFADDPNAQPKQRYRTREEYDKLREQVQEYYWLNDGQVNIAEMARQFDLDRSTVTAWTREVNTINS